MVFASQLTLDHAQPGSNHLDQNFKAAENGCRDLGMINPTRPLRETDAGFAPIHLTTRHHDRLDEPSIRFKTA